MSFVFSPGDSTTIELPTPGGDSDNFVTAELRVGNKRRSFLLKGPITIRQLDRVQVDASADGAMHVVSCKGAVGRCEVVLLDSRTDCSETTDFAIKCYTKEMKSLSSRKVSLTLHPDDGELATFSGVVVGSVVRLNYTDSGLLLFTTTLELLGSWDK